MTGDDLDTLEAAALASEVPDPAAALDLARALLRSGDNPGARRWAAQVASGSEEFGPWTAAATVYGQAQDASDPSDRLVRLALLGSSTTTQLAPMLRLAGAPWSIDVTVSEPPYGQFEQEILDPSSGTWEFDPTAVVLAVHHGATRLAEGPSDDPAGSLAEERDRWLSLWAAAQSQSTAHIVQHLFAIPPTRPFGHLTPGRHDTRARLLADLNHLLAEAAAGSVGVVDCEHLASMHGKERWFDERYWFAAKQAVGLSALPTLARHTMAVIAAQMGLTRKCVVVDLDNTLWGGVVGEVGPMGVALGPDGGARGEAFSAFQDQLLSLRRRGVLLAVASKNDEAVVREVFETNPAMRITLDDVSAWEVGWNPKPESVERLAATLSLGLDSLVFVDDNPAEREAVRQALPEVDVVVLGDDPATYGRALDRYLGFEPAMVTAEDLGRAASYRAKAATSHARSTSATLDDFLESLDMIAEIDDVGPDQVARVHQLINKTNQFNLTTRRHDLGTVTEFANRADAVCLRLHLRDRFADHGLVAVLVGVQEGEVLDIDTLLMSCRVIGRTAETALLGAAVRRAADLGCTTIRGTYEPTSRNALVADFYDNHHFALVSTSDEGTSVWEHQLADGAAMPTPHIHLTSPTDP